MTSFFDLHASNYDASFSDSPIGTLQRERVHHFLEKHLPARKKLRILEINCGTGVDAFHMASLGHEVTATDASQKMIEACTEKLKSFQSEKLPRFIQADFARLKNHFSGQSFDLIFSNFGGMNCVGPAELISLSRDLAGLLTPGGKFIAVVMGRKCAWERAYFSYKGDRENLHRRRSKEAVQVRLENETLQTWYYSPSEFAKLFTDSFVPTGIKPVGLFIPPSYLNPAFRKKPLALKFLFALEKIFSLPVVADHSDHFLLAMQKKP